MIFEPAPAEAGTTAGTTNCGRPILHLAGELVTSYPKPPSAITLELPVLAGRPNAGAGLALKTRVVRTADHTTRPAADAQCLPKRSERVTSTHDGIIDPDFYPLPDFATVNRVWGWQRRPVSEGASWRTVLSYHEAGHAVCAEAFGWPGVSAWQDGERGQCATVPADPQASPPAFSPAQAALLAVYPHAGLVAEQILSGRAWAGPIGVFESVDFAQAEGLLAPHFGCMNSGAHHYAQRYAAHLVAARWERVQAIAAHLMRYGQWHSDK